MASGPDPFLEESPGPRRKVWQAVSVCIVALIVLPLAFIYLDSFVRSLDSDDRTDEKTAKDVAQDEPTDRSTFDAQAVMSVPKQEPESAGVLLQKEVLAEAALVRLQNRADRTEHELGELSEASNQMQLMLTSLLEDQLGRRIASSPELIEQFISIREKTEPYADDVFDLEDELRILVEPLGSIEPNEIQSGFVDALNDLSKRIEDKKDAVRASSHLLGALQSVARTRQPGTVSLAASIESHTQSRAEARLKSIAEAAKAARQAEVAEIARETAENERRIAAAEVELRRAREASRLAELEAKREAERNAIARAKLEAEFRRDLPEIRQLLRPFITDGMTQPGRRMFVSAPERGPVSLAKLRGAGLLEPTVKSRKDLYGSVGSTNDRDLGAFPRYIGGAQDVQEKQPLMQRVQDLLNTYGELMIEKKMLAP